MWLARPGADTWLSQHVSYQDGNEPDGFAIASSPGAASSGNLLFDTRRSPRLCWGLNDDWSRPGPCHDLAGYRGVGGQETETRIADPELANVPADAFSVEDARSYDFCSPFLPSLCEPLAR